MIINSNQHDPSCSEGLQLYFTRFYFSLGYAFLYCFVLVVNFVLMTWLLATKGKPEPVDYFVTLEFLVSFALLGEVALTSFTQTRQYLYFDLFVLLLCMLSLLGFLLEDTELALVSVTLVTIRYLSHLLRMTVLIRHFSRKNPSPSEVKLEAIHWEDSPKRASQNDHERQSFV